LKIKDKKIYQMKNSLIEEIEENISLDKKIPKIFQNIINNIN
jgi:hypothetical protein